MLLLVRGDAAVGLLARPHVRSPATAGLLPCPQSHLRMTTPGSLAILIILFVVLFTSVADTILSLIPFALFLAAVTYIVRHV